MATRKFKITYVAHMIFLFGSVDLDSKVWSDWELSEKIRSELHREFWTWDATDRVHSLEEEISVCTFAVLSEMPAFLNPQKEHISGNSDKHLYILFAKKCTVMSFNLCCLLHFIGVEAREAKIA